MGRRPRRKQPEDPVSSGTRPAATAAGEASRGGPSGSYGFGPRAAKEAQHAGRAKMVFGNFNHNGAFAASLHVISHWCLDDGWTENYSPVLSCNLSSHHHLYVRMQCNLQT